jgi:hypothetical protein
MTTQIDNTTDAAFIHVRNALVERAGGMLSLTDASKLLGIDHKALHQQIIDGNTLGIMADSEIAIPRLQITTKENRPMILRGIEAVTKLFQNAGAGPWMALQFLADLDPNLGRTPIDVLQEGGESAVVQAARAYLHLDEG